MVFEFYTWNSDPVLAGGNNGISMVKSLNHEPKPGNSHNEADVSPTSVH